jgi:hypothetical protein
MKKFLSSIFNSEIIFYDYFLCVLFHESEMSFSFSSRVFFLFTNDSCAVDCKFNFKTKVYHDCYLEIFIISFPPPRPTPLAHSQTIRIMILTIHAPYAWRLNCQRIKSNCDSFYSYSVKWQHFSSF